MTSRTTNWQKGLLWGFVFTAALSFAYTIILIIIDLILESRGLPHMCFIFTESAICTFEEAIKTRMMFFLLLLLSFGLPVSIFSALIGFAIDKIKIR